MRFSRCVRRARARRSAREPPDAGPAPRLRRAAGARRPGRAAGDLAAVAAHAAAARAGSTFPPLRILFDLAAGARDARAHALVAAAAAACHRGALILAAAGPVWNPVGAAAARARCWSSSTTASRRRTTGATAARRGRAHRCGGARGGRAVALLATAEHPPAIEPLDAGGGARPAARREAAALSRRIGARISPAIERFLAASPGAEVVWISDGVAGAEGQAFSEGLARVQGDGPLTVLKTERAPALALAGIENAAGQLDRARRAGGAERARRRDLARARPKESAARATRACASRLAQPRPRRASTCRSISGTTSPASRSWARARPEP